MATALHCSSQTCRSTYMFVLVMISGFSPATAFASEQPPACWLAYEDCARQAAGDPTWRSVCYADFSSCTGKQPLPACPASGTLDICIAYRAECRSFSGSDATLLDQCADDYDACTFAHGC